MFGQGASGRELSVEIVGAASSLGAPAPGCERGPEALRAAGLTGRLRTMGLRARWQTTVRADESGNDRGQRLAGFCAGLAQVVRGSLGREAFPLVVGGDHSSAVGTWSGACAALAATGPLGLVWIDAHLDAHTPATSPSGAPHGMPLACLLGHGDPRLVDVAGKALSPAQVCVIGARSCEEEETQLLRRLGVRVIPMEELRSRGPREVAQEALRLATAGTCGFGLTLDLDALDPSQAPGVATPVPHGLRHGEAADLLAALCEHPGLLAFEVAELDPTRDRDGATTNLAIDLIAGALAARAQRRDWIGVERRYGAHNYDSLPVVMTRGEGVYLWDTRGRRYIDMMSAYSAVSLGHANAQLLRVLQAQAAQLAVTSRACFNERLPLLLARLCELTGLDRALPVNTGLEAVETALKAARKWAYTVKGVPDGEAGIIACEGNFHGRSIAILAMSTEARHREGFGPYPPGFACVPYGDARALQRAISPETAAFLVEPIQGEGGIRVPPPGYLAQCARICSEANVLLLCDEVQTGLGRTGALFACMHENVKPDAIILGKALGGGLLPVSALVGREDLMAVFGPGEHGSTFGGNPLAAAVALAALELLADRGLSQRAAEFGAYMLARLRALRSSAIREVRGRGLLVGVELNTEVADAGAVCRKLLEHGVLTKDSHGTVVRFAPPLIITKGQLDEALRGIAAAFAEFGGDLRHVA